MKRHALRDLFDQCIITIDELCQRLAAHQMDVQWERDHSSLRIYFNEGAVIATELAQILQLITETEVTLVAINSLHDEMVDAFIRVLEEERSHGFSRIFQVESETDAIPGHTGN